MMGAGGWHPVMTGLMTLILGCGPALADAGRLQAGWQLQARPQARSQVMVLVSFSMPRASLKQWLRQARRIQAPVVVRGLVHHSLKRTMQRVRQLQGQSGTGIQLNPLVFRRFQITRVPAVVVTHGTDPMQKRAASPLTYDVVYGDVSLRYALNQLASRGEAAPGVAGQALERYDAAVAHDHD
jgi:conjugal transfer pilus assembly protein TrbC